MKALKEKRLSLRSFLKGSLVILSVMALLFAACSSSDDDDDTSPTSPTGPVTPPAVYAESITVLGHGTVMSYQGMPTDLTGVILSVKWSNSATAEIISGDLRARGFYTAPGNCDEAGYTQYGSDNWEKFWPDFPGGTSGGPFPGTVNNNIPAVYVVHEGSKVESNELKIPGVIPAWRIELTGNAGTWYSDQAPDFSGIILDAQYQYDASDPANSTNLGNVKTNNGSLTPFSIGGGTLWADAKLEFVKVEKKNNPIVSGYPPVYYGDLASHQVITATVGGIAGDTIAMTHPGNSFLQSQFKVATYAQIRDIEFESAADNSAWFVCDDQTDIINDAEGKISAMLDKAGPIFKATYSNGESRSIGWTEFKANVNYIDNLKNTKTNPYFGDGGISSDNAYLLALDDNGDFTVILNYVPRDYGTLAYVSTVRVGVPGYEWSGDVTVGTYKTGRVLVDWLAQNNQPLHKDDQIFKSLKDHYFLVGTYERRGATPPTRTREIELTEEMFGWNGTTYGDPIDLDVDTVDGLDGMSNYCRTVYFTAAAPAVAVANDVPAGIKVVRENVPIPINYLGTEGIDLLDEDTIRVDVWMLGTRP